MVSTSNPSSTQRVCSFLVVATGVFMATMDSSMINVALPTIMRDFSCTFAECQWVVLSYLLTITISLPLWGHVSDRFGKTAVYIYGMLLFVSGSAGCGYSPTLVGVVLFRFIQATGAAMMMAAGPAIVAHIAPVGHLGRVMGLIGVATSAGLMSGPAVSGFLLNYFSWRFVFFVTIPLGLFMFILARFFIFPKIAKEPKSTAQSPFGWLSFIYWALFVSALALISTGSKTMDNPVTGWQIPLVVLLFLLFSLHERKATRPLIPKELLRKRFFVIGMMTSSLSFAVLFIVIVLIPFYLAFVLELTPMKIGAVMMALPISLSIVSPLAGRLFDSLGAKKLTTMGLFICAFSVGLLAFLKADSKTSEVMLGLAFLGMGQSIFLSPNSASVLSRVEEQHTGVTSGFLATSRNLGMLFGVALASMVFTALFFHFTKGMYLNGFDPTHVPAFLRSLRLSFLGAAILSLASALISVCRE